MSLHRVEAVKALRQVVPSLGLKEALVFVNMYGTDVDYIVSNHISKDLLPSSNLKTLIINRLLFKEEHMIPKKKVMLRIEKYLNLDKNTYLTFNFQSLDDLTLFEVYTIFINLY